MTSLYDAMTFATSAISVTAGLTSQGQWFIVSCVKSATLKFNGSSGQGIYVREINRISVD